MTARSALAPQLALGGREGAPHPGHPEDRGHDEEDDEESGQRHGDATDQNDAGHPARLGHHREREDTTRPCDATVLAEQGAFTLTDLTPALLVGSLVLLVSVAAVRLSVSSGLPSLLLYLGIGLAIGEAGLGIQFDSAELTQVLGYAALVLILAEGGLTTSWQGIRASVAPAAVLADRGGRRLGRRRRRRRPLPARPRVGTSLLVGAILSSTDAAAVFSVLRRVPLPRRITGMLEAESGFNDAPVVILVIALATASADPAHTATWWVLGWHAAVELAGGAAIGLAVGWLGGQFMRRVASGSSGLFSIGVMSLTVLAYAAAAVVHTSGFIAATSRRWCWATWPCRTGRRCGASPPRWAGSPRSGCSSCSACSPRPRTWATRSAAPSSSGWCCCWSPARCRCWSR